MNQLEFHINIYYTHISNQHYNEHCTLNQGKVSNI